MSVYVYFVRAGEHVKIGTARNVSKRVSALRTSNALDLEVLGVMAGGAREERLMHSRFAHLHVRGEWFRADVELLAFVAENGAPCDSPAAEIESPEGMAFECARFCVDRVIGLTLLGDPLVRGRALVVLESIHEKLGLYVRRHAR